MVTKPGPEIELDDLTNNHQNDSLQTERQEDKLMPTAVLEGEADELSTWAWASAIWLVILSIPLLVFPRFLLFVASPPNTLARDTLTPLESFLSLQLGIGLLVVAFTLVTSVPSHHPADALRQRQDAVGHPLLIPLTVAFWLVAFLAYNTSVDHIGQLGFVLFIGNGGLGLWGAYVMIFQGPPPKSKKTGADKHTSSFLFGNKNAASAQKKKWRKEQLSKDQ